MKLVTSAQMHAIDRETIDRHGITGPELMEHAGQAVAERIFEDVLDSPEQSQVVVYCGKGNNGGDGFVIARALTEAGVHVSVYFIGPVDRLSPDARLNYDRLLKVGPVPKEIVEPSDLPEIQPCNCVIDAVFGTGFTGSPDGIAAELIEHMNLYDSEIISIDLPSGLNGDNGQYDQAVVTADRTYTLSNPKYGLFLSPGRELAGLIDIVPIGIPENVISKMNLPCDLIDDELVAELLPERKPDGHKGDFGKLLIIAGSSGYTGAAALSSLAAARSGCGLIKLGCPATLQSIFAEKLTEVMTIPLPDVGKKGALALRGFGEIKQWVDQHDAIAIGPGLGQHHETKELMHRIVTWLTKAAVIDADGLNAFAGTPELIANRPGNAPLVITPHPGEFTRLTGKAVPQDIQARIQMSLEAARELRVVLVLKGSPTLVASPEGKCYLNPTGNSGMAKGGSGDVLTGMIGSFLAQGCEPLDAAIVSVYLHGVAGDFAADTLTERSMIAGDVVAFLPAAFKFIEE
jgi:ADP-dependent NAD(P)H-hydrate dehydratase / NAD(P)H-hydrate epimerase